MAQRLQFLPACFEMSDRWAQDAPAAANKYGGTMNRLSQAAAIAAFLSSASALAQSPTAPIFVSKDWKLEQRASNETAAGVCVASTKAAQVAGGIAHNLEIVLDRAGILPLEVRISPEGDVPATLALKGAIDKKKEVMYSFARMVSADAGRDVFWNIPRGTEALVSFLKREMRFDVVAQDGTPTGQALVFSLRGSSATIDKLQSLCNSNKPLVVDAFERAFLPATVATVDASKLTPAQTSGLRALALQALAAHGTSLKSQAELNALTTKYLKEINELNKLRKNLDQLTQQEIVKLQKRKADAEGLIVRSQSEIDALRPQIAVEEGKLASANSAYEAAYNILKPLMPEHDRLEGLVDNEASAVSSAKGRLNQVDQQISSSQSRINELERSLESLRRELAQAEAEEAQANREMSSAQQEASRARSEHQTAESDLRRYDRDGEIRRRASSRLGNVESEIRDLRSRLNDGQQALRRAEDETRIAENELRQCEARQSDRSRVDDLRNRVADGRQALERARQETQRAEQELRSCESQAGADCSRQRQIVDNSRGREQQTESRLAQLERELQDAINRSGPQTDCSRERQQVSNARQREDVTERRVEELEREVSDLMRRRDQVMDEIEREVDREYSVYVERERAAESRLNQAESRLNSIEQRAEEAEREARSIENQMRNIASIELPRTQSALSSARSERPSAEQAVRRAESDLSNANAAFDRFEKANDWDRKHQAVRSALATVNGIKAELVRIDKEIKRREATIRTEQQAIVDTQKQMDLVLETIRQKEARSVEVQKLLEPYEQQKAVLEQAKAAADATFGQAQRDFAAGLPQ